VKTELEIFSPPDEAPLYMARVLTGPDAGTVECASAARLAADAVRDAMRERKDETFGPLTAWGFKADRHGRWSIYVTGRGQAPVKGGG
jgi:hypothetical protein